MVAILDNLLDQQFTLGLCLIFRFNSMQIQPLLSRKLIVSFNEICHFFRFIILSFRNEIFNVYDDYDNSGFYHLPANIAEPVFELRVGQTLAGQMEKINTQRLEDAQAG